jgi:6-phosphogluconolactonase (cycloisomerase 2 family)
MRMKFNKTSQLLLVSAASLLAAGALAACGTDTVDFVFVASSQAVASNNNYGEINVFEINQVSGFMRQIPTSPFPSDGRKPVAEAVSKDYTNLYVVNQDDNTIVQFLIGSDGKLYPQNTVNTPGIFPLAVAVSGSYLFVADTFQPSSCTPATPCSGSVGVFPILTDTQAKALTPPQIADTLGAAVPNPANPPNGGNYWPLTLPSPSASHVLLPTAVNVLHSGSYVYVTAFDCTAGADCDVISAADLNSCDKPVSSFSGPIGYVFGFSVSSGGALAALPGSPFAIGTHPCAIASDSTGSYVYITDQATGKVLGYSVASTGALTPLSGSPFPAGNQPSAIAVDPKYPYAFVANALDGTVSAYSIGSSGALTSIGTYATGVDPVAIGIDPGTSHFVFTANFLGNQAVGTVSDFELNTSNGALVNAQHSPFNSNALPTAVAAVPHTPQ